MRAITALLAALCVGACAGHRAAPESAAPRWSPGFVRLTQSAADFLHISADSLVEVPRAQVPPAVVAGATTVATWREHDPACLRFFRDGDQFLAMSIPSCRAATGGLWTLAF